MTISEDVSSQLGDRFAVLLPHLNERQRRLAVATEARLLGHGGVRIAAQVAGMSESTVRRGVAELEAGEQPWPEGRVRAAGGGRKRAEQQDLLHELRRRTVARWQAQGDRAGVVGEHRPVHGGARVERQVRLTPEAGHVT